MADLAAVGIDYDDVIAVLEKEGVDKFVESWNELLDTVSGQMEAAQAMSETAWNTVNGKGTGAEFELFFGYPDEKAFATAVELLADDKVASRIAAQGPDAVGAGRRGGVRQAARLGGPVRDVPPARHRDLDAPGRAPGEGPGPGSCSAAWAARRSRPR